MSDPGLRASDAERDRAVQELREHYAVGRITQDELDGRLDAVYRATTTAELAHVRADLPLLPAARRAALVQRRAQLQRQLLQQVGGSMGLFVLCVAIWAADGAQGSFWPVWVLIAPILLLARNGWRLYGPAPDLDSVQAELERHRSRSAARAARHTRRRGLPR